MKLQPLSKDKGFFSTLQRVGVTVCSCAVNNNKPVWKKIKCFNKKEKQV